MGTTLKMIIEYDGTRYQGFSTKKKSACIESKLQQAVRNVTGQSVQLFPAVKTEPAVHAAFQIVSFVLEGEVCPEKLSDLKKQLNDQLPADIAVSGLERADARFVASLAAVSCTYTCRIARSYTDALFRRPYVCVVSEKLDVGHMREAAEMLVGSHDFSGFSEGRTKKSTVRRLQKVSVEEEDGMILITLTANSFLRHMPQLLVGALLAAGRGECKTGEILLILSGVKSAYPACPSYAFTLSDVKLR